METLTGGAGTDTLAISDTANGVFSLPTAMTMTGVENITLSHLSDAAADVITVDVTNYADVDSVTIVNAGTDINTVTVNGSANLQSVTISGGNGADIAAVIVADAGTVGSASTASTDAITTISLTGVTGTATITSDALTSITVNNVAGIATNTDGYVATTDVRTLNVTHNGGTNGGVLDAGATTVNFNVGAATTAAGTNTFAAATTLNVDVNAALTAGTIIAAAATDVNVNLDAAVTAATITTNAATTVDYTGTANAVITQTGAAAAVFTNSGTGNLTLNTAIAAGQQYVGGAGVDTVTFAATGTTASTLGAGDDVATFSAVAGTGGSVDGGAGTDTVSMTTANAVTLSAATDFEADIANFEVLSLAAIEAAFSVSTISLANLDDINSVTLAGALDNTSAAAVLTISGFTTGGTFTQTAALLGATNTNSVTLTGSFTGTADVMNVGASAVNGFANVSVLTIAAVETINITTNDTDTTAATTMFDLNLVAANATTITLTGDAGMTFASGTHTNVVTFNADGVTATGAAGVVTFTATTAQNASITGGAGNDVLTGGAANDTITGGVGNDTLGGAAGNDTISGGAGADTITGGTGVDTMTGGAGVDIFVFSTDGSVSGTSLDVITDYSGDELDFGAAGVLLAAETDGTTATSDVDTSAGGKITFAAADDTFAEMVAAIQADTQLDAVNSVAFFEFGGDTFVYYAGAATGNTDDQIVELSDVTGLTTITLTGGDLFIA